LKEKISGCRGRKKEVIWGRGETKDRDRKKKNREDTRGGLSWFSGRGKKSTNEKDHVSSGKRGEENF